MSKKKPAPRKRGGFLRLLRNLFLLALVLGAGAAWLMYGDYRRFAYKFSPTAYADLGLETQGTFCSGPSYPDGKCPS